MVHLWRAKIAVSVYQDGSEGEGCSWIKTEGGWATSRATLCVELELTNQATHAPTKIDNEPTKLEPGEQHLGLSA